MSSPETIGTIPDQENIPGDSVTIQAAQYLKDIDATSTVTYSATGFPSGTGLSINTSTGVISGTPTAADLAESFDVVVTCTDAQNNASNVTYSFVVSTAPAAAQTYYINGSTGNDSYDGESATVDGGGVGPWKTISRANTVSPHDDGHVDVMVAAGTYRNQVYTPANSGTDDTHRIRLRASGGVVELKGPSSGAINYVIDIATDYISILREDSSSYFRVDGEVVFGTDPGEVAKGGDPSTVAHIRNGIRINGDNVVLDLDKRRTAGWNGVEIGSGVTGLVIRINGEQHGTPFLPTGQDYGDSVSISLSATGRILLDGGSTGRIYNRGGHSGPSFVAGNGALRGYSLDGRWASLETFSAGDGNRALQFVSKNAQYWHFYNNVIQGSGQPSDQPFQELIKLEGSDNVIVDSILRNSDHEAIKAASASWSFHARRCRVAHCVMEYLNGPLAWLRTYTGADVGTTPLIDYVFKNLILRNVSMNPRSGWENLLMVIELSSTQDFEDVFPNGLLHGVTIQDASRDLDDFKIRITGGGSGGATSAPGTQTVSWWVSNYPALVSDIDATTDANLDNAPASGTDADVADIITEYSPVSDSLSVAQGVALTTVAAGDSGSGTTLLLNDARWLQNPVDGSPGFGERSSSGHQLHCQAANRTYTAVNYATGAVTLSSGFSRSPGDAVNLSIASGNDPNRGIRGKL